jgi:MYXO-CTERM domain-containing protein
MDTPIPTTAEAASGTGEDRRARGWLLGLAMLALAWLPRAVAGADLFDAL